MAKWFEDNPLGKTLAIISGSMLTIILGLTVAWSLPAPKVDEDELEQQAVSALELPVMEANEPIDTYAVIAERPVFNESRRPVVALAEETDEEGDEEDEEVDAPEVTLAGVVITPDVRMVTLKHKDYPESLIAFEGQPLEGNFGSWHVSRIDAREITLSSGDGREVELKLEVNKSAIKVPEVVQQAQAAASVDGEDNQEVAADEEGEDEPMTRADEIRQRIAERREELRRAAEEQSQQNPGEPQKPQSYSAAIQNMMTRKKDKDQDENQ